MRQISERIISDVKVVNLENFDVEIVERVRIDEAVQRVVVHDHRRQVGERAEGSSLNKRKESGFRSGCQNLSAENYQNESAKVPFLYVHASP